MTDHTADLSKPAQPLDPLAFSPDGYIIDQRRCGALPYGHYTSDWNGCGWIATFNLLRTLGREETPEAVCNSLAEGSPFHCRLGTGPRRLLRWLRRRGIVALATPLRKKAIRRAERCRAGIVLYWSSDWLHFVAFARHESGNLRFFNCIEGNAMHVLPMDTFLESYTRRLPVYVITVN